MNKVLVTGFEAFGGESTNPSWRAVSALDGTVVRERKVVAVRLPTVFGKSAHVLTKAMKELSPELVISVGEAGGSSGIRVERFALNLDDARIEDNEGNRPSDTPISEDGPVGYFATIPTKRVLEDLLAAGIPAALSYSAGTYVCNHVFFAGSHFAALHAPRTRVGFLHVPYLPEQVTQKRNTPSMAQQTITEAVLVAIQGSLQKTL